MEKTKNVLFIAHHNNDFDHFLPLIIHLKKDGEINCKTIAFYTKHEILKNKLHKYICDLNDIKFDSMVDISYFKNFNRLISKMYKYVINERGLSNPSGRIRSTPTCAKTISVKTTNNLKQNVLNYLEILLIRYFVLYSIFLLTDNKMRKYIDSNNIDLAIIDHRRIEESFLDTNPLARFVDVFTGKVDPMDLVLFRFAKATRANNIPIFMIPHGPQPILIPDGEGGYLKNPFNPDFLVVSSQNDLIVHHHMKSRMSTLFLGDPRFDIGWINYLESCVLKVYEGVVEKPKDKKVLLYLMDNYPFFPEDNQKYKFKIHKDILSLVNHFQNLEIWVKHHPRFVFEISIDSFVDRDKQKNIKQFGNDTDTNILLANADICLSAISTALISPILQKRPVIFYYRWKEMIDAPTIYDEVGFKASSKEELIIQYKNIINGEYRIDEVSLNYFYENVFSGICLYEDMTEKYARKIIKIMNGEKMS